MKQVFMVLPFDRHKALNGQLCVVVKANASLSYGSHSGGYAGEGGVICNIDTTNFEDDRILSSYSFDNEDIIGFGFCTYLSGYFYLSIGSETYTFDSDGNGVSENAQYFDEDNQGYRIYVVNSSSSDNAAPVGDEVVVQMDVQQHTNDNNYGDRVLETFIYNQSSRRKVTTLNARDQFAIIALESILEKVANPSGMGYPEMQHYCEVAYKWAECMMISSASRRAVVVDSYWKKGDQIIKGDYENYTVLMTDSAQSYDSAEEAESDGWTYYEERKEESEERNINVTLTNSTLPSSGGGNNGSTSSGLTQAQVSAIARTLIKDTMTKLCSALTDLGINSYLSTSSADSSTITGFRLYNSVFYRPVPFEKSKHMSDSTIGCLRVSLSSDNLAGSPISNLLVTLEIPAPNVNLLVRFVRNSAGKVYYFDGGVKVSSHTASDIGGNNYTTIKAYLQGTGQFEYITDQYALNYGTLESSSPTVTYYL